MSMIRLGCQPRLWPSGWRHGEGRRGTAKPTGTEQGRIPDEVVAVTGYRGKSAVRLLSRRPSRTGVNHPCAAVGLPEWHDSCSQSGSGHLHGTKWTVKYRDAAVRAYSLW